MNRDLIHRGQVGGMWDEIGKLQYDFMLLNGLNPHHRVLDIACGCFRAGRFFLNYLNHNNYYGIDKDLDLIEAGNKHEISQFIQSKKPNILHNRDFEFYKFGVTFDYMIAQSLWTHLDLNSILRCIINIKKTLNNDGKCFVTFFENTDILCSERINQTKGIYSNIDSDPYHYTFRTLRSLIDEIGMSAEYIGEWGHHRNQKMLLITQD